MRGSQGPLLLFNSMTCNAIVAGAIPSALHSQWSVEFVFRGVQTRGETYTSSGICQG